MQRWMQPSLLALLALPPLVFAAYVVAARTADVRESYEAPVREAGDFRYLRNAARIISSADPAVLYEGPANRGTWEEEKGYQFPGSYPYAPAFAYGMTPLTLVSDVTAFGLWKLSVALLSVCLAVALAAQFRSWAWRLASFAAVVAWEPILLNARIGQTGVFVATTMAIAALAFVHDRTRGGAALGLLALKPSTILGPGLIVFPERTRVWLAFAAAGVVVGLLPFLWLGPDALESWIRVLLRLGRRDLTGGHSYNQGLTALVEFGGVVGYTAFAALLALAMATVNLAHDRAGVAMAAAFAVLAGLLLNPHSLLYEWGLAFLVVLLIRRGLRLPAPAADVVAGLLVVSLFFLGQWEVRDPVIRPLTAWALAVAAAVALYVVLQPRPRATAEEPEARRTVQSGP